MSSYLNDPDVLALIKKKEDEKRKTAETTKFVYELSKDPFWDEIFKIYKYYHSNNLLILTPYEFKNSIENDVKNTVKEYIDEWWGDKMDEILLSENPHAFYLMWQNHLHLDTIVNKMRKEDEIELWVWGGNTHGHCSHPPPPKHWKGMIVRHIANPLIEQEYHKLANFYIKYKERSIRESQKPSPQEAKKIIKELEEKVILLTERNSILEEKFAIFSKVVSIN